MAKEMKIPRLPYGQGSITYVPDRDKTPYKYRKRSNGTTLTVYGTTPKDAMERMSKKEKEIKKEKRIKENKTLSEAIVEWLKIYKKPTLKSTSYNTLSKTVNNYIVGTIIGNQRLDSVSSDLIQTYINSMNDDGEYSYSTIKKIYDALNNFFRDATLRKIVKDNPMLTVTMINRENIKKDTKEIEFFEQEDIELFQEEAVKRCNNGVMKYSFGYCLCANIYLGMRGGELLALKWKDVDFEKNVIWVHENLQLIDNPKYDSDRAAEMQLNGVFKQIYIAQSLKNYQNRSIHMNKIAKEYLLMQYKSSKYTSPDDYVCCNQRTGDHTSITGLSANIKRIEIAADTTTKASGTHILRHTCASLYFRHNVKIEIIAAHLGHSVEVCRKTYIHFVEEQMRNAAELITDLEI